MRIGFLLFLLACRNDKPQNEDTAIGDNSDTFVDVDQDGYAADPTSDTADCDDTNSQIHPGAAEICDGVDNNCDGVVDEGVMSTFYADEDGDGFGDPNRTTAACEPPENHTTTGTDCDDGDAESFPGAGEQCDNLDNDCDGEVDEGVLENWYADADGDGYGDPDSAYGTCDPPPGYIADNTDCDDTEAAAYPGAKEICDGVDNNCDSAVDEDVQTTYYQDTDGDGFGIAEKTVDGCFLPTGYATVPGDCNDGDSSISPNATEVCDDTDNDCDGDTDSDAIDRVTFYADSDSDGYGDASATTLSCDTPSGYVSDSTDCNDSTSAANPGETEICDAIDNDCDGDTDENTASDASTWYADGDGDGYGGTSSTIACTQPSGYADNSEDCDDGDGSANPGETEICDAIDNDCDGDTDEGLTSTFYLDADADGYGTTDRTTEDCEAPTGYSEDSTDCDDSTSAANPGETEICDEIDNDCDGDIDEGLTTDWYLDYDGDGYGDSTLSENTCSAPSSLYVSDDGDCDDLNDAVYPGAAEVCDGTDANCDGDVDNDSDGDGYASADCGGDDCDDDDGSIVPELDGGCALGVSCADIQDNGYDDGDGEYTIDPDGYDTGVDPFVVYCDMTTDGGGWTFIANISDSDDDNWSAFMPTSDAGLWDSTDTFGDDISFEEDHKSAAFVYVDSTALLIKEEETNVLQTEETCWSEQPFGDFISSLSWSATGSDYTWDDSTGAYLCDFTHFSYTDTVLRAGDHSGSERVVGFKWGEADGAQDGNKDRTMITTYKANGYSYDHHVDLPTGLGGFTSYSGAENYEDANECQGDGPDRCTNSDQNYQLFVR